MAARQRRLPTEVKLSRVNALTMASDPGELAPNPKARKEEGRLLASLLVPLPI